MLSEKSFRRRRGIYYSFLGGSYLGMGISLLALVALVVYIVAQGAPNLSLDLLFGEYSSRSPSIVPATLGTLYLVLISLGIGAPIGILAAVFLSEYSKSNSPIVKVIRLAVETLSGIPSIVYGLFGYLVFVAYLKMGYSLLGGGITLALMVLPVIVRGVEESLRAVPNSLREASFARHDLPHRLALRDAGHHHLDHPLDRQGAKRIGSASCHRRHGRQPRPGLAFIPGDEPSPRHLLLRLIRVSRGGERHGVGAACPRIGLGWVIAAIRETVIEREVIWKQIRRSASAT